MVGWRKIEGCSEQINSPSEDMPAITGMGRRYSGATVAGPEDAQKEIQKLHKQV